MICYIVIAEIHYTKDSNIFLLFGRIKHIQRTSNVGVEESVGLEKLWFCFVIWSTGNNNNSWTVIFKGFIVTLGVISAVWPRGYRVTRTRINQCLDNCCVLNVIKIQELYVISYLLSFINQFLSFHNSISSYYRLSSVTIKMYLS